VAEKKPIDPLLDGHILHRIAVERMQTGTIQAIDRLLGEASVDLEQKILRAAPSRRDQLAGLLKSIKEARLELFAAINSRLTGDLTDLAKYEAEFKEKLYSGALGAGIVFNRPSLRELEWLVKNEPISGVQLKGWVDKLSKDELFKLNQQIRIGMAQAETPAEIARRLVGYKHLDGVVKGTSRNATMLARTAYTHVQAEAEMAFLLENKEQFPEFLWISVLDERTSTECRHRAGNIYKVEDYENGLIDIPPIHPNCRSQISGIPRGYDKTGLTEDLSFESWLQRTSDAARLVVLGKKGLNLWKKGKLPAKRFIDPTGAAFKIDDVQKADAETLAMAGAPPEGVLPPGTDYGSVKGDKGLKLSITDPTVTALPLEQQRAANTYTSNLGYNINSGLRGLSPTQAHNTTVEYIDQAIAATKTKEPLTVRRFLDPNPTIKKTFAELQPGDSFREPGYTSTTLRNAYGTKKLYALRIHVPKGSEALYVAPVSSFPSELELLLPRGSRFEVVRKYEKDGVQWMDVKLIPRKK
jgi:SPP1 gp7 family putative phage head morphogenesis protein